MAFGGFSLSRPDVLLAISASFFLTSRACWFDYALAWSTHRLASFSLFALASRRSLARRAAFSGGFTDWARSCCTLEAADTIRGIRGGGCG